MSIDRQPQEHPLAPNELLAFATIAGEYAQHRDAEGVPLSMSDIRVMLAAARNPDASMETWLEGVDHSEATDMTAQVAKDGLNLINAVAQRGVHRV